MPVVIATRERDLAGDPAVAGRPEPIGATGVRWIVAVALVCSLWFAANASGAAEHPFRWWANFIVLPSLVLIALAIGLAGAARETRFVLVWLGAIVFTVAWLLFTHSMGPLWPMMIIVPALGPVTLFGLRPADPSLRAFVDTVAGLATVTVALGLTFLAIRADLVGFDRRHWWGWFMLAAAAVPAINGVALLVRRRGTYWFSMAVLLVALGVYTMLAGLAELGR